MKNGTNTRRKVVKPNNGGLMTNSRKKLKPMEIESKSMQIIAAELGECDIESENLAVLKRVIHTSADFEYANNLIFSKNACQIAKTALQNGATIVADTTMVMAGINKKILAKLGGCVKCFIADEDVAEAAKQQETTRSEIAMQKASKISGDVIFAIGNAPTALFKIRDMIDSGEFRPALIIGVPVGFVNVVESKEEILSCDVPHIVAKGRKGGSNVAAAIVNALLYQIEERE